MPLQPVRRLLFALFLSLFALAHAQQSIPDQPPAPPLLKVNARAVIVDVVVTGPGDSAVPGLHQQDFAVTEEGKPQTIDYFQEHTGGDAPSPSLPALPPHAYSNQPASVHGDTATVLLLDSLNTSLEDQARIHKQVQQLIARMDPGTQAALFSLGTRLTVLQAFTADRALLQAALASKQDAPSKAANSRERADDLENKEDVSMQEGAFAGKAEERSLAEFAGNEAGRRASSTLDALSQLSRVLASTPGRKNVFWFADSFPVALFPEGISRRALDNGKEIPAALRQAVDLLTQSRIALYPVSAQGILADVTNNADSGLQSTGDNPAESAPKSAAVRNSTTATMEQLAHDSGGEAIYTANDLGKDVARVIGNSARYYTLAYKPAAAPDGKFRRVQVKLAQGTYKLAYRRGYYADNAHSTNAGEQTPTPATDPLAPLLAHGAPSTTQILYQVQITTSALQPAPNAPRAGGNAKLGGPSTRYNAAFTIPVASLDLDLSADGTHTGKVEVALIAYSVDGKPLNWTASQLDLSLSPAAFEAAKKAGIRAHLDIDLPNVEKSLSTGVYSISSQRAGTLEIPLVAEPAPAAVGRQADALSEVAPSLPAAQPDPVLAHRPPPKPASPVIREGQIHLDLQVTDAAGKPVTGLDPWDFTLVDNGQPRKILSFNSYDGDRVMPDPPTEAILVLDTLNLPFQQVAFVRQQADQFLRQNGGHLKVPVSIMLLTDKGLRVQPRPSTDGNALAGIVAQLSGNISSINSAMGPEGLLERFQMSVREITAIAENETKKPGRKLLIWVGPGWPILDRPREGNSEKDPLRFFDAIVELSSRLREARMVVDSVAPGDSSVGSGRYSLLYQAFLKGVPSPQQANSGNLGLKVLATQTGGQILGPSNDLAEQIGRCLDDANAFYRISFDAPPTQHPDEYHDLKVQVNKPGMTVRTNTGYYNEPAKP